MATYEPEIVPRPVRLGAGEVGPGGGALAHAPAGAPRTSADGGATSRWSEGRVFAVVLASPARLRGVGVAAGGDRAAIVLARTRRDASGCPMAAAPG